MAGLRERERETFVAICTESVNHVVRQTEWDCFRFFERRTLDEVRGMIAKKNGKNLSGPCRRDN